MRKLIPTMALLAVCAILATAKPDNELTLNLSGLQDSYLRQRTLETVLTVTYQGVPQPATEFTFTVYDSHGDIYGTMTRLTDENGQMTCNTYFARNAKLGIYTLEITAAKDGLTGRDRCALIQLLALPLPLQFSCQAQPAGWGGSMSTLPPYPARTAACSY
jgi:hypothetical protein